jgi:hypothetical protein
MRAKLIITCLGLAVAAWMIAPTVASAQTHLACYQVKDLKVPAKLLSKQTGTHADAVTTESFEKCKLKYLCIPTSKDGSGIADPSLNYNCYQCKGATKPAVSFDFTDQYNTGRIETKKLKFICNPIAELS